MRRRRPRTALTFILMGVVLLVAIFIGQRAGDKMLFLATQKVDDVPELQITPAPDPSGADDAVRPRNWRRLEVVSVATDPAFPDPRVTPVPTPTPRPPPPPTPPPTPRPLPSVPNDVYTPPPLPIPIVSHEPGDEPTPFPAPT